MKISSIHIDGFGIFSDARLAQIGPGLTVINAFNGGGKTTFRDFVRACLFSFPNRTKDSNRYERPNGAYGGLIEFSLHDGAEYRLNFDAKNNKALTTFADGTPTSDRSLLLGSASLNLYQNVFAIGLKELQQAGGMDDELLRGMIGGFGSGESGLLFTKTRSSLSDQATKLFTRRAPTSAIKVALSEHQQLQHALQDCRAEAEKYWTHETELEDIKLLIAGRTEAEAALRQRHQHLHALKQAWPHWVALTGVRKQLAELQPPVEEFPVDGSARLASATAEILALQEGLTRSQEQQKLATAKLQSLTVNHSLLDHSPAIDEANEGCRLHEDNLDKRAKLQADLKRANEVRGEETARLGPGGAAHLASFDSAVAAMAEKEEAGRGLTDALRQRTDRATALEAQNRRLAGAAAEAEKTRAAFSMAWPTAPPEQAVTDGRLTSLSRIRTAIAEAARFQDAVTHANQLVAATEEALAQSEQRLRQATENAAASAAAAATASASKATAATPAAKRDPRFSTIAACLLAAGTVFAVLARQTPTTAVAAFAIFALLAIACFVMGRTTPEAVAIPPAAVVTEVSAHLQPEVEANRRTLEEHRKAATVAATRFSTSANTLRELCQTFAGKPLQTPDCNEIESKLMDLRERRRLHEIAAQELRAVEGKVTDFAKERALLAEAMEGAETGLAAAQQRWDAWLQAQQLPAGLPPAQADALVLQIEKARAAEKTCESLTDQIKQVESRIEAFTARLTELLTTLGHTVPADDDVRRVLTALRDERDTAKANRQQRDALAESIAKAAPELNELGRKLEAASARHTELLREAGATDAADFALRAAAHATRRQLQSGEHTALEKLELLSAPGEAARRFQAELASLDNETLEQNYLAAQTELDEVTRELADLHFQQGEVSAKLDNLANHDRVAELQQDMQTSESNLRDLAEEWAVRKLAFWLMEKARTEIETARQPLVLQSAGACLTTMSGGRFTGLVQPLGTTDLHVIESGGLRRDKPHTWNTALKEKTYLSLRFGLIDSYCTQAEPLPIILDDPLVNLDPANCAGALRCIDEMAQRHQIFYLTCHPHTLHHFAHLPAPPPFYEIRDGVFHAAALPQA